MPAREVGDRVCRGLSPAPQAVGFRFTVPGVPLRSTPGFTLSPAPQAGFGCRFLVLLPQIFSRGPAQVGAQLRWRGLAHQRRLRLPFCRAVELDEKARLTRLQHRDWFAIAVKDAVGSVRSDARAGSD